MRETRAPVTGHRLTSQPCLDVQGRRALEAVHEFLADSREPEETITLAQTMLREAMANHQRSDDLLARHARHWDLGRLAMVDRNILRLAVYELQCTNTPPKVVITEALRLAQEFSTAESPRFVNGVIDAVMRELKKGGGEEPR